MSDELNELAVPENEDTSFPYGGAGGRILGALSEVKEVAEGLPMSEFENELAEPEDGDTSFPYGHNVNAAPNYEYTLQQTLNNSVRNWKQIESEVLRRSIYNELEGTSVACFALEQSWVRLGILLSKFKQQEHWRSLGYLSYDDFLHELKVKFKRGRTILYGYVSAVEALLPIMNEEAIEKIGISKALELKRAQKQLNGKPLPASVIIAAASKDVTASDLRAELAKVTHATEEPKGTWLDLQGFFITADERAEFKEAFLATESLLGLSNTVPDHIRRKEVFLCWMREWYGTHATEINGVQQPENVASVLVQRFDPDGSLPRFKVSAELLNDAAFDDAQHEAH